MIPCWVRRAEIEKYLSTNLAIVDSDDGSYHLWDDDHVPQMCLDHGGLFVRRSLFFGLP